MCVCWNTGTPREGRGLMRGETERIIEGVVMRVVEEGGGETTQRPR